MPHGLSRQHGFTVVEMVATVALMSILLSMAFGSLSYYFSIKSLETSARELTTQIREAQARAVSTGNTWRIDFSRSDTSYMLQRHRDGTWVDVLGPISLEGGVRIRDVNFSSSDESDSVDDGYVYFLARGTSEDGHVVIEERFGRHRTVEVEGETVNVKVS
ncbi:MAG: prepilin-type N-terminal cleavage/methylation domain-containing protein [Thermoleophilia bacterium]|nr:prepilin-type N-terminal cleavage/methylation domain-containing protein [Thermoleophilia bacterium]